MSKAEDRARDLGYGNDPWNRAEYTANDEWDAFIEGYEQAEKDSELTWEDMRELHIAFAEIDADIELGKINIKPETVGYYQVVLRRFKNLKK